MLPFLYFTVTHWRFFNSFWTFLQCSETQRQQIIQKAKQYRQTAEACETTKTAGTRLTADASILSGVGQNFPFSEFEGLWTCTT